MPQQIQADQIARSPHKIDRDSFVQMFALTKAQPWLEFRQTQLLELLELCSNLQEQKLILDLLYRFTFMSADSIASAVDSIARTICVEWSLKPASARLVSTSRSEFSDSSQSILWLLKPAIASLDDDWNTTHFVSKMTDAVARSNDGDTIVIVDEFVGSGETLTKAIGWFQRKLIGAKKNVKLVACVAAAMEASREALDKTGICFYSAKWLKRGISDFYEGEALSDAVARMTRLENELSPRVRTQELKKYHFGYKRTEAIYYYENGNIPNNVFPVFWWPKLLNDTQRRPLFRRLV